MLFQPDDFQGDWYGWLTNQAAHVLLGMGIFAAVSLLFSHISKRPHEMALIISAFGYGFFEYLQGGTFIDSVADWAFVMSGAFFAVAAWHMRRNIMAGLVVSVGALLVVGVWRRK
ncbi:hypothetical protein OU789_10785 [Halocynthiibacter sp. C4]|uniref:hypothetical protein n=1 Tax=Halocynthiibacter sp. C4 TaxID=2992758 RepID=UPI00237AC2BF|nr:hypothetical protein [Halocynthiibacter sp. C4]MDE0590412.1 hypothetical protein [Halocynthiibacter sp. C4]